jgi:hypothetical protein
MHTYVHVHAEFDLHMRVSCMHESIYAPIYLVMNTYFFCTHVLVLPHVTPSYAHQKQTHTCRGKQRLTRTFHVGAGSGELRRSDAFMEASGERGLPLVAASLRGDQSRCQVLRDVPAVNQHLRKGAGSGLCRLL